MARIKLLEKDIHILTEKTNMTLEALQRSTLIDPLLVTSQNDMTQFYIKALGITAGVVIILVIASNIYPTIFSIKALLPSYVYNFVQTNTPFLETKKRYILLKILHVMLIGF